MKDGTTKPATSGISNTVRRQVLCLVPHYLFHDTIAAVSSLLSPALPAITALLQAREHDCDVCYIPFLFQLEQSKTSRTTRKR